jgi:DNA polymerase-1
VSNEKYLSILEQIKKDGGQVEHNNPNDKVLIIDGLNTFIRVFSVVPITNEDGAHVGGIIGFLKSVGYAIKMHNPTRCIIVFDGEGGSDRRRKLFPDYKAKRRTKIRLNRAYDWNTPEDEHQSMLFQMSRLAEYLQLLPLTVISANHMEADDAIGYITKQILTESKITIMSTDKDFLQLVDDRVCVWSPTKKKKYTPTEVQEEFGIPSHNFLMYKIIDGDKSDNIPGIKGVALKTIQKCLPLLQNEQIVSIEEVLKYIEDNEVTKNVKSMLTEDNQKQLQLNNDLMQLNDVNISGNAKLKIKDIVDEPIQQLIKFEFTKMFLRDKLFQSLPNVDSWLLTTFSTLNKYAGISNER